VGLGLELLLQSDSSINKTMAPIRGGIVNQMQAGAHCLRDSFVASFL